jgi:dipeptidase E
MKSRKARPRQIVAMGGGGFAVKGAPRSLHRYILALSGKGRPRVAFVATASGDAPVYVRGFHKRMSQLDCIHVDVPLFFIGSRGPSPAEVLARQDVIFVGGGNTANMLAIWRLHGIDKAMRAAWKRGCILAGASAGMICWFECGVTDSFGPLRELKDGLGFLGGSACPHYDGEVHRRPTYRRLVATKVLPGGVAADDGAALHFVGTRLLRSIASRPGASAYSVVRGKKGFVEQPLPTILLNRFGRVG